MGKVPLGGCGSDSATTAPGVVPVTVTAVNTAGILKDIAAGNSHSKAFSLATSVTMNGNLYFLSDNASKLWVSVLDSNIATATLVKDAGVGHIIANLKSDGRDGVNKNNVAQYNVPAVTHNRLYFTIDGRQLWSYDDADAIVSGTNPVLAKAYTPTNDLIAGDIAGLGSTLTILGDNAYFQFTGSNLNVWLSIDGAEPTEVLCGSASYDQVVKFYPGSSTMYIEDTDADNVYAATTDVTTTGTTTLVQTTGAPIGAAGFAMIGDDFYFQSGTAILYSSVAGATAYDIEDEGDGDFAVALSFFPGDTTLYFHIADKSKVYQGCATPDANCNARIVKSVTDIKVGPSIVADTIYFQADEGVSDNVYGSVSGGTAFEVFDADTTGVAFLAANVAVFYPGTTVMYMSVVGGGNDSLSILPTADDDEDQIDVALAGITDVACAGDDIYYLDNDILYGYDHSAGGNLAQLIEDPNDGSSQAFNTTDLNIIVGATNVYVSTNAGVVEKIFVAGTDIATADATLIGRFAAAESVDVTAGASAKVVGNNLYLYSDGTSGQEQLLFSEAAAFIDVTDFTVTTDGACAGTAIGYGSRMFFIANDGINGCRVWTTDGTTTTMITSDELGLSPAFTNLTMVGSYLYYVATDDDGSFGLYKSTAPYATATTVIVTGITETGNSQDFGNLTAVGDKLYFSAYLNPAVGNVVFVDDSGDAVAASALVEDEGTPEKFQVGANAAQIVALSSTVALIRADLDDAGNATDFNLYRSAANAEDVATTTATVVKVIGTAGLTDSLYLGADGNPIIYDGYLYFIGNDAANGVELWRTKGAALGADTTMVKSFAHDEADGVVDATIAGSVLVGDKIYFLGDSGNDLEVFVYDIGDDVYTQLTKDWNLTNNGSGNVANAPTTLTAVGTNVFFEMKHRAGKFGIFKTDGTVAGTTLVYDLVTLVPTIDVNESAVGTSLFFTTGGDTVWTTDGTTAGTNKVVGSTDEDTITYVSGLTSLGTSAIFSGLDARENTVGGIMSSTTAGVATSLLDGVDVLAAATKVLEVTGAVYFKVSDPVYGVELYKVQ